MEGNADEQASRNTRASGRNGDARFRATSGPASPDDQREFDKYYTKRVNDTRKSDRDDIAKDVKHMQELMGQNGIPSNVPYAQIASTGNEYPARTDQRYRSSDCLDFISAI